MASGNCVADVRKVLTAAVKRGDSTPLKPSEWASKAGYHNSAASPLRKHMARDSGNGCGRQRRYPPMTAEVMLETLDLADTYAAEKEQRKREVTARKIGARVRPATVSGAKSAKRQAQQQTKAKGAAKKGGASKSRKSSKAAAPAPDKAPAQAVDQVEAALEAALS